MTIKNNPQQPDAMALRLIANHHYRIHQGTQVQGFQDASVQQSQPH